MCQLQGSPLSIKVTQGVLHTTHISLARLLQPAGQARR